MKKSLSLWSVNRLFTSGVLTLTGFVEFAAGIGAEAVEIVSFLLKEKDRQLPELMRALEKTGLSLAAYSISSDFAKPTEQERTDMLASVCLEIETAASLGCAVVRVFSSDFGNGLAFDVARGYIVDGLKKASAHAARFGVTLALENHGYYAGTAAQMQQILSDVDTPNLRVTLDIGNFILMDDDPAAAAKVLAPFAALAHVKDFYHVRDYYPLKAYKANSGEKYIGAVIGSGVIDVKYALEQLHAAQYAGFLSLEYDGGEADTRENLGRGMEVLSSILSGLANK